METILVAAVLLVSLLMGYRSRQGIYLGPLDPLKLLAVQEAAWSATVAQLRVADTVGNREVIVFALTLLLWWTAWGIVPRAWSQQYREAAKTIWLRILQIDLGRLSALAVLYVVPAAVFAIVAVTLGGGDNRLAIAKVLRPLEAFTSLLVPVILFRILVSRHVLRWPAIVGVLALVLLAGGKGAVLVLLLPITAAQLVGRMKSDARVIRRVILLLVVGFLISVTINYGAADPLAVLQILGTRILLEGDVYLVSFGADALSSVTLTSLWTYVFGPLIKASFLPIEIDQHVGSQMASSLLGEDTPTGPNAHWPILLMALDVYDWTAVTLLSIFFFASVVLVKLRTLSPGVTQRYPIAIMVPMAMFVLQYPHTFFMDPPFQFVFMVQALFLSLVLCIVLLPFDFFRNARPLSSHRIS